MYNDVLMEAAPGVSQGSSSDGCGVTNCSLDCLLLLAEMSFEAVENERLGGETPGGEISGESGVGVKGFDVNRKRF